MFKLFNFLKMFALFLQTCVNFWIFARRSFFVYILIEFCWNGKKSQTLCQKSSAFANLSADSPTPEVESNLAKSG